MRDSREPLPLMEARSRTSTIALWTVAALVLVPAWYGFIEKFIQFVRIPAVETDEGGGFIIIPIVNYLMVTAGMTCLLVWAVANGMFRDIERPKYTLLERDVLLDRRDGQDKSENR